MKKLLLLFILTSCASTVTEAEKEEKEYEWQEHVYAWNLYTAACLKHGGHIVWRSHRACMRRECIPQMYEWKHWYDEDGTMHWNSASIGCAKNGY
jgi:hypothetical protein